MLELYNLHWQVIYAAGYITYLTNFRNTIIKLAGINTVGLGT